MSTIWGESITTDNVLQEYPRPQMKRKSYINLNGLWAYSVTDGEAPIHYNELIVVPFSPECELSGEVQIPKPNQTMWYKTPLKISKTFNKGRILLHFGAVDWYAQVFINGKKAGEHKGGYTSFCIDITEFLQSKNNELLVKVVDPSDSGVQPRGKQKTKNGGIWYTTQSGIWQTVWLESVPEKHIRSINIAPFCDSSSIFVTVNTTSKGKCSISVDGKTHSIEPNRPNKIILSSFTPWTPENPHLHTATISFADDKVETYFAMRNLVLDTDKNGTKRFFLNGKEYFCNGILDQGYWPDGLYTAASDEALQYDIIKMKELGFNTIRKHIKIEPMRWYYHCDRLGMLVWQDMINGGGHYKLSTITLPAFLPISIKDSNYKSFAQENEEGREQFVTEYTEMLSQLKNCPCIVLWVPFNEGWGQFDSMEAYELTKKLDPTRLIDHASGWHDQGIGDFKSLHIYFRPYRFKKDTKGRAVILSEFGGYSFKDGSNEQKTFSYKKLKSKEDYIRALRDLYLNQILTAKKQGLAASIYTQVSDVEEEINGILSYDRKECKIEKSDINDIFVALTKATQ